MQDKAVPYLEELIKRYPVLRETGASLYDAYHIMLASFSAGGTLLVCGNGGSASDAEHIVAELMKSYLIKRRIDDSVAHELKALEDKVTSEQAGTLGFSLDALTHSLEGALPAISLTSNTALLTAYGNDVDPTFVFAQQVYAYGKPGDVLFVLSTSGNSANVIAASYVALVCGMKVIALTGISGGKLGELVSCTICVPEQETFKVQELHLPIYHALCAALEAQFFGRG